MNFPPSINRKDYKMHPILVTLWTRFLLFPGAIYIAPVIALCVVAKLAQWFFSSSPKERERGRDCFR